MFNSELVTINNGKAVTNSLSIAEHTNNSHQAILKLINKYKTRFERKSGVGFEIQPFQTAGGLQHRDVALLDERQGTQIPFWISKKDWLMLFWTLEI